MGQKYCTQADLERALGGAVQLVQLLDKNGDNQPEPQLVAQVLEAATGEIASYFVNIDLRSVTEPYSPALITKTAAIAAFYAWSYGAYGQGIPENIIQAHDAAVRWAQDVGNKRASLGVPDEVSLKEKTGVIDYDTNGSKVSIAGFRKGFR